MHRVSNVTCQRTEFWLIRGTFDKLWTGEGIKNLLEVTMSRSCTPAEKRHCLVCTCTLYYRPPCTYKLFKRTQKLMRACHSWRSLCLECSSSGGRHEWRGVAHAHVCSSVIIRNTVVIIGCIHSGEIQIWIALSWQLGLLKLRSLSNLDNNVAFLSYMLTHQVFHHRHCYIPML